MKCKPSDNLKRAKPFSKDNQPSPKAKSEGRKRWEDRKKLRENLYREFLRKEFNIDGKMFFKGMQHRLMTMIKNGTLTDKEKADLILKIINLLSPEEKEIRGELEGNINITISKEDAKL